MEHTDVLIAGGGLNGPALALALAGAGLEVVLADPRPAGARGAPGFDGRAYALAHVSVRLLRAVGLWDALAPEAQPILQVRAAQARRGGGAGRFALRFDSAEIEEGPLGWMVEDRHLSAALDDALAARGVRRVTAAVAGEGETPGGIDATLADGTRLTARLLVGADGRGSGIATRAGIRRVGRDYGQTALVAAVGHATPHAGVAHQLFLKDGPLAILPLTGDRSSIVWSMTARLAREVAALDDARFLDVLRPAFGDFLGEIALAGPRFAYPLTLSLATRHVAPRRALIGDAAHGVHPVAGQGLNLGLRDVAALAECVADAHRRGEDLGGDPVLDRYQTWRRGNSTALALGMDAVTRLFATDAGPVAGLRGLGIGAVQAIGPLRRAFMRQAAGLSLDPLPRLLAGRAL